MTRFARAKGSKSSNDRLPDESTPWHIMKQQLEDSTTESKRAFQEKKSKTANVLLREIDESYYGDPGTMNHDWAEFESENEKELKNNQFEQVTHVADKKKKKSFVASPNMAILNDMKNMDSSCNEIKIMEYEVSIQESINNGIAKQHDLECHSSIIKKKRKNREKEELGPIELEKSIKEKKKKHDTSSHDLIPQNVSNSSENLDKKESNPGTEKSTVKLSKRQKRNRKNRITLLEGENNPEVKKQVDRISGTFNTEGNEWSTDVKFGYKKKLIPHNDQCNQPEGINQPSDSSSNKNQPKNLKANNFNTPSERCNRGKIVKKRKPPKIRDDNEHKRKKPHPGSTKVIINGMEVEIVMYDGFPVKKEDADRLKELRQQMVMKGIPKSEIDVAMKLERRKAEKALARVKKNVCFHCRKAGHNLSDCPDLGKEETATGICFKCGSTEHTHFECKIIKKEEFGYAKCFICREQGHIAKQCPDNPKGLYPNGGACKICGDVTHLKKDCPDIIKEKKETTLTLNTIGYDIIDSLESEKKEEKIQKVKNKIVNF